MEILPLCEFSVIPHDLSRLQEKPTLIVLSNYIEYPLVPGTPPPRFPPLGGNSHHFADLQLL